MDIVVFSASVLFITGISILVNKHVPSPYMDEVFHIPQAQDYCDGDYKSWDHHITTFPGLYILSSTIHHIGGLFGTLPLDLCSIPMLRMLNIPLAIMSWVYGYLLCKRWTLQTNNNTSVLLKTCVAMSVPFVMTYHSLYYTDTGSLAFVLAAIFHMHQDRLLSFVFAILAVLFRQNNIVWVAFSVLLDAYPIISFMFRRPVASVSNTFQTLLFIARKYIEYAAMASAFLVFVLWNQGVVVGDKSAHQPVLHIAQLAYLVAICGAYCTLELFVVWIEQCFHLSNVDSVGNDNNVDNQKKHLQQHLLPFYAVFCLKRANKPFSSSSAVHSPTQYRNALSRRKIIQHLLASVFVFYLLYFFSFSHPYLLSDNRHISFYLWQRFLGKSRTLRSILAPVYITLGYFIYSRIVYPRVRLPEARNSGTVPLQLADTNDEMSAKLVQRNAYWFWTWFACSALALVPAQLLEFRYFSIPLVLFLLRFPTSSARVASVQIGVNVFFYLALTYLFLFKPFTAPDGTVGRFLW